MCPEFDMMEANKYAFKSIGHKCEYENYGDFTYCDRSGQCSIDVLTDEPRGVYEPGSTSGIDTNREFHVKQEFHQTDGVFTSYSTTLS